MGLEARISVGRAPHCGTWYVNLAAEHIRFEVMDFDGRTSLHINGGSGPQTLFLGLTAGQLEEIRVAIERWQVEGEKAPEA